MDGLGQSQVWRYSSYPDYAPGCESRTVSGMRLLRAASAFVAQAQLEKNAPGYYWMRRRGMDHIWHLPHDEGACWAPREIRQGIMITPYGYHAGIAVLVRTWTLTPCLV